MPQIVTLKAVRGGYQIRVGRRVIKTVNTPGEAKAFLSGKYGAKFEVYNRSTGTLDGSSMIGQRNPGSSMIGQRNPRLHGPLYFVLTQSAKSSQPSLVVMTTDRAYADKYVELVNHKGNRAGIHATVTSEFPSNYSSYGLTRKTSGWFANQKPKHGTITSLQKEIDGLKANPSKKRKPAKRRRNIAMGITLGTGANRSFRPIRSSPDYDPSLLSGSEGRKARGLKASDAKARKVAKTKTKMATKARKVKKAVRRLGSKVMTRKSKNLR